MKRSHASPHVRQSGDLIIHTRGECNRDADYHNVTGMKCRISKQRSQRLA